MGFSKQWDDVYRDNAHMSVWPWSDVISYVMRNCRPIPAGFRVLELGCGAGANIPFFKKLEANYCAIEGSESIVKQLEERYPELKGKIVCGDFTQGSPFEQGFDLIVDRASLTHNTTAAIRRTLRWAHAALKPGGKFIGIDWFSTSDDDFPFGEADEDAFTRREFKSGHFAGVGRVHFSDQAHLLDLFGDFRIEILEQKIMKREIPNRHVFAYWNLLAKKEA